MIVRRTSYRTAMGRWREPSGWLFPQRSPQTFRLNRLGSKKQPFFCLPDSSPRSDHFTKPSTTRINQKQNNTLTLFKTAQQNYPKVSQDASSNYCHPRLGLDHFRIRLLGYYQSVYKERLISPPECTYLRRSLSHQQMAN